MQQTEQPVAPQVTEGTQERFTTERARRLMALTGFGMLAGSSVLLIVILVFAALNDHNAHPPPGAEGTFVWFMRNYGTATFGLIGSVLLALVGVRMLGAAERRAPSVIPAEDRALLEPLVREANKEAIGQYVILSSLTGFTGTFQKIGFSGLPLATVGLTLLFCALSFVKPDFIELAKLTLGTFIGSFVQRGMEGGKLPSIDWKQ